MASTKSDRKPGRPMTGQVRRKRYLITLEPATAEIAYRLGNGNRSLGVELALLKCCSEPVL